MPKRIEPTAIKTVPSGSDDCDMKGLLAFEGTVTVGMGTSVEESVGMADALRPGKPVTPPTFKVLLAVIKTAVLDKVGTVPESEEIVLLAVIEMTEPPLVIDALVPDPDAF